MAIERVVPDELEPGARVLVEHLERYELAASLLLPGDEVVDAACGSGYGSAQLARHCRSVRGYDVSAETIAYARTRYPADNLEFHVRDLTAERLPPCDVVVSFETLEHLPAFEFFLGSARTAARRLIVLSTPIIPTKHFNPYHVHDFTREQVEGLMAPWRAAYCCVQGGEFGVWAFTRSPEPDDAAYRLARLNLRHQQEQSERFERRQAQVIEELRAWVADLEKGKAWLEGQRQTWERTATEREQAIRALEARVRVLERVHPARRPFSTAVRLLARLAGRMAGKRQGKEGSVR
jgi:SAM-dependent methyltransferase